MRPQLASDFWEGPLVASANPEKEPLSIVVCGHLEFLHCNHQHLNNHEWPELKIPAQIRKPTLMLFWFPVASEPKAILLHPEFVP